MNSGSHSEETNQEKFSEHKRNYDDFEYASPSDEEADTFDLLSGADKYGEDWENIELSKDFTDH